LFANLPIWAQSYKKKLKKTNFLLKKARFLHFFAKNIWSCEKKAVPLHPISGLALLKLHTQDLETTIV